MTGTLTTPSPFAPTDPARRRYALAAAWAGIRTLRFADGPDEVHKNALARAELKRQAARG